jgi:hypothetical protein
VGELGGYLTLQNLPPNSCGAALLPPSSNVKLMALGRHCLELVCQSLKPSVVYAPRFTCHSVKSSLAKSRVKVEYYSLDGQLLPDISGVQEGGLVIVNNYFGLLGFMDYFHAWMNEQPRLTLLVDDTQSIGFGNQFPGEMSFVSPRKFLPVTDGGILYDDNDIVGVEQMPSIRDCSWERVKWLFRSIDEGGRDSSYSDYLVFRAEIQSLQFSAMSAVTEFLLAFYDLRSVIEQRRINFEYLNKHLRLDPKFCEVIPSATHSPIGFPLKVSNAAVAQKILAERRIYAIRYWPELQSDPVLNDLERELLEHFLFIPLNNKPTESQINFICGVT